MKNSIIIVLMAFISHVANCQDKTLGFANYLLDVKQKAEFKKATFDSTAKNYKSVLAAYTQVKNNQKKIINLFLVKSLQNRNLTKELKLLDEAFLSKTLAKLKYTKLINELEKSLDILLSIDEVSNTSVATMTIIDGVSTGIGIISSGIDLYQKILDINKDRKMAVLDIIRGLNLE